MQEDVTQHIGAEERLRESNRRFATLLSNTRAYVYRCLNEPGWPNEFASDYALELTGYPPEELLVGGKVRFGDLIVEEDRQRIWDEVQAALAERRRFRLRYAIRRRDGEIRHVEEFGQGVYGEDGEVEALEGIVYDVTELKQTEEKLRDAEARYRTLVEQIPAVTYIQQTTDSNAVTYVSPQMETMLGYKPEVCTSDPDHWIKILHPEDRERVLAEDERTNETGEPFEMEYRQFAKDGRVVWVRDEAMLVRDEEGRPLYWLGVQFDITERKEAEKALLESERRFRQLFENSVDALFVHDEQGRFVDCNAEACRALGYTREELLALSVADVTMRLLSEEARRKRKGATLWERAVRGEPGRIVDFEENELRRKDGTTFPVEVGVGAIEYEGRRLIFASARDVTERKALELQLRHQALHDPLTGLPNRTLFMDRLGHALARADRRRTVLAVLFLDLDDFKVINDSLSHDVGDRLLVAVARRLRACLRPEDTAARLGGDEFAVLLEDLADVGDANRVAERIAEALAVPFVLEGQEVFVTASVGIALADGVRKKFATDLLRDADLAMYRAKGTGKAHHQVFEEAMNGHALKRLETGNGLRRALEREEFVLYYQPIVTLRTVEVMGFEALVRWKHPERGFLLPDEFVRVAEETGIIASVGQLILEEACRQAQEWQRRYSCDPPLTMFVNLSARQFQDPDLSQTVTRVLEETGLDPCSLYLEITESTAMEDAPTTAATLGELKALGVRGAIDDFGTGYSSLSYLERFPVDYLKIDRSFVDKLGQDPGTTVLVSGMIDLAHALGIKVIAEGVETAAQLQQVRDLGCDLAQGNYFSEPLPGEAASALLRTRALG